jgi:hypothetical protein
MKTYLADIIPKIQRFSKQLDSLTLLTNQHWVVIDGILEGKSVYIFRPNGELLISTNGRVEKARWELLGQNSILVDMKNESFLFKHGFLDENVLALKIDGRDEYAFLLNENGYSGELNSVEQVIDYLVQTYFPSQPIKTADLNQPVKPESKNLKARRIEKPAKTWRSFQTEIGELRVEVVSTDTFPWRGDRVMISDGRPKDGKYSIGFLANIHVRDGIVMDVTMF